MPTSPTPALHTDRYELTMLNAALGDGTAGRRAVFEVFSRFLPTGREFGVVAGTDRAIEAILNFRFTQEQIDWLIDQKVLSDRYRDDLLNFAFRGNVVGYPEGELYFTDSPVLRIEGTFGECVVLETLLLSILNHDTAIASTAAQMFRSAKGRGLIEMGSRRTHEESAVHAARAAYIAGFDSTSNLEAGWRFAIPTAGTSGHAAVLAHESELDAFITQIDVLGVDTTLLVDTYDIHEGIRTAVKVANQFGASGPGAIRIDSGDLLDESRASRELLDSLGASSTKIVATGDLDQSRIAHLLANDAPIDRFGVGTRLVTGENCPSPGFIYKLVEIERDGGSMSPVAKLSVNKRGSGGTTYVRRTPQEKLFKEEPIEGSATWTNPQVLLMVKGRRAYEVPSLLDIRRECVERLSRVTEVLLERD
jgi:nicotinate phosphoribosyltransferase